MIPESAVLFAVQHLQQCRKCISLIVCAHLIYLIQKHDRILRTRGLHGIGNPSRHSSHIGLPVSADLRLITHAAQRNSYIWLFQCSGQ